MTRARSREESTALRRAYRPNALFIQCLVNHAVDALRQSREALFAGHEVELLERSAELVQRVRERTPFWISAVLLS